MYPKVSLHVHVYGGKEVICCSTLISGYSGKPTLPVVDSTI